MMNTTLAIPVPGTASGEIRDLLLAVLAARPTRQSTASSAADHRQDPIKNQMPEAELADIRLSQGGDPDAFARVVKQYTGQVSARMWTFTRDRNDLDDLVQEVFIQVYYSIGRYRPIRPFGAWLNRIATRVGYRYWKRRQRDARSSSLEDWDGAALSTNDDPDAAAERLHGVFSLLRLRDRLVLTLIYWEGCSVAEAADRTGWSKAMVKVQAHRARGRLKRLIEKAEAAAPLKQSQGINR